MSDYNDLSDFSTPQLGFDALDSEDPALPADPAQSEAWTAPLQPLFGVVDGDTAAQLQLDVDSAPDGGAEPLGPSSSFYAPLHDGDPCNTYCTWPNQLLHPQSCAVCLEPYQTDSALHRHAIESQHQAYKCECGTDFNKASALKRHIDSKHGSKTFPCPLCDDKFARKDKVKDHCRLYHKVTDEHLRLLLSSQELKPRAGVASRRRQARVPRVAASSASSAYPAHAPAPAAAGPSVWSFPASTGQQYVGFPAGPFIPTGPPATTSAFQTLDNTSLTTGQFVPSADAFAVDPALDEDLSSLFDGFVGDETRATPFSGLNF